MIENPVRPQAGLQELHFKRTRQIQHVFAGTIRQRHRKLDTWMCLGEEPRDLDPHFEAARANPWPKGGDQIGGPAAEVRLHGHYRLCENAVRSPTPARMNRRNRAAPGIRQQDWKTISYEHTQGYVWHPRRQGVAFAPIPLVCAFLYDMHLIGMDLAERREVHGSEAQSRKKPSPVLCNTVRRIPGDETEVQRGSLG